MAETVAELLVRMGVNVDALRTGEATAKAAFRGIAGEAQKAQQSADALAAKFRSGGAAAEGLSLSTGNISKSVSALNKAAAALQATGIGLGEDDVKIVGQVASGLSLLAAGPLVGGLAALGIAAAALRGHLRGIQEEIDKGVK